MLKLGCIEIGKISLDKIFRKFQKFTLRKANSHWTKTDFEIVKKYFEKVPDDLVVDIFDLYKYDYIVFGYELPLYLDRVTNMKNQKFQNFNPSNFENSIFPIRYPKRGAGGSRGKIRSDLQHLHFS